ncbi:hypothetical protein E2C01_056945 [Portunus trituberculatus]|uniref:Uncharacterized protein n=1 Tax=Portunus trituberculatus TaxID=210409 RepID=A0A5B7GZL1_PORTR|nr:hypothetical protein [Portunus trituberculatus]
MGSPGPHAATRAAPTRPASCHTAPLNGVTSPTLAFFSSYVRDYLRIFFKSIFSMRSESGGAARGPRTLLASWWRSGN